MTKKPMRTAEIKAALLGFYESRCYKIYQSFPLATDDPTLLFTNATITPFKGIYANPNEKPRDYALIQKCIRVGGASDLCNVGVNPYYFAYFEMFGGGCFSQTADTTTAHLLDALETIGLRRNRLYFTVPSTDDCFTEALAKNDIQSKRIFPLSSNGFFWQEWKFGKHGPIGHGLTAIYSRTDREPASIDDLSSDPEQFLELLNLIHIHSIEVSNGGIEPIANAGFDLGGGVERLAAAVQDCNSYQTDGIAPLVTSVARYLSKNGSAPDEPRVRMCVDHLRMFCVLANEGIKPSNKSRGYVLRKIVRRTVITVWQMCQRTIDISPLLIEFARLLEQQSEPVVDLDAAVSDLSAEQNGLKKIVDDADLIMSKNTGMSGNALYETYGISPNIIKLSQNKDKVQK